MYMKIILTYFLLTRISAPRCIKKVVRKTLSRVSVHVPKDKEGSVIKNMEVNEMEVVEGMSKDVGYVNDIEREVIKEEETPV